MPISLLESKESKADGLVEKLSVKVRKSEDRGSANHGWLNTYHTFSFAMYYDEEFEGFGPLRVLNEDRVKPGKGFGTHGHSDFEIFSYIVSGELTHKDSLGNTETLKRGDVQFTSAGTGIRHSEYNWHKDKFVHFLQIWVEPTVEGLKPRYETKTFKDEDKFGKLLPIVSAKGGKDGDGAIRINQDVVVLASIIGKGTGFDEVKYDLKPGRALYVHLIQDADSFDTELDKVGLSFASSSFLEEVTSLKSGDGAFVKFSDAAKVSESKTEQTITFKSTGESRAEFLVFDVAD